MYTPKFTTSKRMYTIIVRTLVYDKRHEFVSASATITTTTTITLTTTLDPDNNNDSVSIPIKTTTTKSSSSLADRDNNNKINCDNKNKGDIDTHLQNSQQQVSKLTNKGSNISSASTEERNQVRFS